MQFSKILCSASAFFSLQKQKDVLNGKYVLLSKYLKQLILTRNAAACMLKTKLA